MSRIRQTRKDRTGFTLIEVLLVLAILVVLGAMAVSLLGGTRRKALIDAARAQVLIFDHACPLFETHVGRMPTSLEELVQPPNNPAEQQKWGGPYIDKLPPDPWGNPYQCNGDGVNKPRIWSYGPDGAPGTADDIANDQ
jgi:general secretion pathway protein G